MRPVEFRAVAKSFGAVSALQATDLAIGAGEFVTLLGPSGSGKTTLLNICAGYLQPSAGRVLIGGRDVTELPARKRNIGMVFQSYALFPHMSVAQNVAYGLEARRAPRAEITRRVEAALALVQLQGYGDRAIRQLSGGQQQRVALARALVIEPDVLLMDEPLGALDRQLRKQVQLEIRRLHASLGRTMIYVTHDQEEALVMSDRIVVMRDGRIEQVGTGRALYEQPASAFVARFLGESNLIEGRVATVSGGWATLQAPGFDGPIRGRAAPGLEPGAQAAALVRPEAVHVGGGDAARPATVEEQVYLGELVALRLRLSGGQEIWARMLSNAALPRSADPLIGWRPDDVRILPA